MTCAYQIDNARIDRKEKKIRPIYPKSEDPHIFPRPRNEMINESKLIVEHTILELVLWANREPARCV